MMCSLQASVHSHSDYIISRVLYCGIDYVCVYVHMDTFIDYVRTYVVLVCTVSVYKLKLHNIMYHIYYHGDSMPIHTHQVSSYINITQYHNRVSIILS